MGRAWTRQRGEPSRAYSLFECFLELGPARSLRKLADTGVASLSYLKQLSTRWGWIERAAAYQAEMAHAGEPCPEDELAQIRERQLKDVRMMRSLARAQMQRWAHPRSQESASARPMLTAGHLARMWEMGFQVEGVLRSTGSERSYAQPGPQEAGKKGDPPLDLCQDPEQAMHKLLQRAEEAGLPKEAAAEAERYLWQLAEELFAVEDPLGPGGEGGG